MVDKPVGFDMPGALAEAKLGTVEQNKIKTYSVTQLAFIL